MNINKPPLWLRKLYYSLQWKIDNDQRSIYLTFDDGPDPEVTPYVLDALDRVGAKGTFFVVVPLRKNIPDSRKRLFSGVIVSAIIP